MRPIIKRQSNPRAPVRARNWIPAIYRHSYAIGLWISDLRVTGSRVKLWLSIGTFPTNRVRSLLVDRCVLSDGILQLISYDQVVVSSLYKPDISPTLDTYRCWASQPTSAVVLPSFSRARRQPAFPPLCLSQASLSSPVTTSGTKKVCFQDK